MHQNVFSYKKRGTSFWLLYKFMNKEACLTTTFIVLPDTSTFSNKMCCQDKTNFQKRDGLIQTTSTQTDEYSISETIVFQYVQMGMCTCLHTLPHIHFLRIHHVLKKAFRYNNEKYRKVFLYSEYIEIIGNSHKFRMLQF